jgi:TonB-linked SusC/RagA family outer membrane protein
MKKKISIVIFCLLFVSAVQAQTRKLSGTVTDASDTQPIIGASVFIKGSGIGTATDSEGHYALDIPQNAKTLTVSFLGMETAEIEIGNQNIINVLLSEAINQMDEVLVVAYGTAKKGSFTGAANQIKSEKFEVRPLTNITGALLGSTPGVQVSTTNGQPGSEPSIYIRGIGSFSASNTPLIILNGMPYDNALSSINPADIESVTVLKDASSSALYGARGGNGVVLIQTKAGNKDRMTVNVKVNQGITNRQTGDYEKLSMEDYLLVHWENARNKLYAAQPVGAKDALAAGQNAAKNLFTGNLRYNPWNVPDDQVVDAYGKLNPNAQFMWGDDTDWLNAVQQQGNRTEAGVNISGGNTKSDYYLSVGYLTEKGYIIGSQFDRYTMNTNINSQIAPFLKVGGTLSGNISKSIGNQDESSNNNSNPFRFVRYIGPIYPIHRHDLTTKEYLRDGNGDLLYDFGQADGRDYVGGNNPAIELQDRYDGFNRNTLNAKAYTEIRFLDGFKFTLNGGVGANAYLSHSAGIYYPEKNNQESVTTTKTNSFTTTWTFNQLLSYSKDINRHHFDVLLGHESYDWEYNYLSTQKKGMRADNGNYEFENYNEFSGGTSYKHAYKTEGYIARLNYDYANRYFLSASARHDGSSRFYKDNRWGDFYSVGLGWRIDQETFMKDLTFVDLLKLRMAYGEVGNDDIATYYGWQTMYVLSPNGSEPGYIQDQVIRSKDLGWEKSQSSDIALEFDLFKSRLSGSIEYFNRQSSNLLFSIPQPVDAGYTDAYQNAGTMYNRGVEIDINGQIVKTKDLIWSVGINATFLKNKITSLPVEPYNDSPHRIEAGHSRYEFYLRQWAGVDPATGNSIYVPEEGQITEQQIEDYDNAEPEDRAEMTIAKVGDQYYTTEVAKALRDWSGIATPSVSGGLTTGISWKGLSLNLLFYYQMGGKMYDSGYADLMTEPYGSALIGSTRHVDILTRWQAAGDITNVPRIDFGNTNLYAASSTRWLVSSDMLELANATLSYELPKQLINKYQLQGLRVYASGDNLLLFTKRQGIYPRRNIFSGSNGNIDVYLPSRVFTIGLNFTF